MKKIVCGLFMYLLISTSAIYADSPIILMSELPTGPVRNPLSISAEQSIGQVQISFMSDIGFVDICVKNVKGEIVDQVVVDTDITPNVVIDTSSWPSGDYVITLTLENGNKLIGEFSL